MPPKPARRSTGGPAAPPQRRPLEGAAQAKSKKEAATRPPSAKPTRPPGGAKKGVVDVPDRRMPQKKKSVSGAPLSYKASAEDDRAARSSSEYMTSASKRMSMLSSAMSGGKKTKDMEASYEMDEETAAEAADSQAMSMLDLLASLEGSGQIDQGIFSSGILQYSKEMGIRLSPEAIASADPDDKHGVLLKCEKNGLVFEDDSGTFVSSDQATPRESDSGCVLKLAYGDLKLLLWDHQHSSVKLRTRANEFVIIAVENSLELEAELSRRFQEAMESQQLSVANCPGYSYLGMFAGPTKPKPFERKRANLTQLKQSKMPALTKMREIAIERHNGPERPMPMEFSRRTLIALDHIHEGQCLFPVFTASGPEIFYCLNAVLVIDDEGLVFENDTLAENSEGSADDRRTVVLFENVSAWGIYDLGEDVVDNGVQLECKDGHYFFSVDDINNFRVCFEYFWNIHRTTVLKLSAQPGTTHGRKVVGVHTLMGEVRAKPPPLGNYQVIDSDGKVVKANAPPKRKKSFLEKAAGEIFGGGKAIPTSQRGTVRPHWGKVVMHNGWLLKKGGLMNTTWIKRYFVLYKTSQGHFLSYYSQYWESPLYNPDRKERNMIDLCKVTFLRARSKNRAMPFSFDVSTIEREWTLCADNNDDLQLWLQLIAASVDEDVAIVPDDTLSFYVKARIDPTKKLDPNDYNTVLQVSTWGVSVQKISPLGHRVEVQFWCYTDFYKWYVMKQLGKVALSVQIFSEGNFKKKLEWVFRTPDAEKISTAIEYFIEKFMSRMHLRRELEEAMAPPPPPIESPPPPASKPLADGDAPPPSSSSAVESTPAPAGSEAAPAAAAKPSTAIGSGDSGNYDMVGALPPPPPPEKTGSSSSSDGGGEFPGSGAMASEFGGDLQALFAEEDEVPSMGMDKEGSGTALQNQAQAREGGLGMQGGGGVGGADGEASEADWASDDDGTGDDEDDLMYSAYDMGMDVIDVDDAATLEKAFSPDTAFFGPDDFPLSSPDDDDADADGGDGEQKEFLTLEDAHKDQMRSFIKHLQTSIQGSLVKVEGVLDLYYRHEYRGSQGRITLMYRNLSSEPITAFEATLGKAAPRVRGHLPKHADVIAPGATQTQMLVLELMTPFEEPPELLLSFQIGADNQAYRYKVPVPITMANFLSPIVLAQPHYSTRWDAIGSGNEATESGSVKLSMDPAAFNSVQAKLRGIKFGLGAEALDEGGAGLLCAAALHTKFRVKGTKDRVLLGFMAKVKVTGTQVSVVVRSPASKQCATLMAKCIVGLLS